MQLNFTPKQGQYLAFIHYYTLINRHAPSAVRRQRSASQTPIAASLTVWFGVSGWLTEVRFDADSRDAIGPTESAFLGWLRFPRTSVLLP
jgi:hypothetical protein